MLVLRLGALFLRLSADFRLDILVAPQELQSEVDPRVVRRVDEDVERDPPLWVTGEAPATRPASRSTSSKTNAMRRAE